MSDIAQQPAIALRLLMGAQNYDEAFRLVDKLIGQCALSPYLLVMKARLILLLDRADGPPLDEAERCLLEAHEINNYDLEVIEELAHFYDVTLPNPSQAARFAGIAMKRLAVLHPSLQLILNDNGGSEDGGAGKGQETILDRF